METVIASLLLVTSAPAAVAGPEQVPHVVASDYRGLGDGIGFGQAKARLCDLAKLFTDFAADPQFRDLERRQVVERTPATDRSPGSSARSSFIFAVEYTDKACPTAYTLMAPARPDLYSAKKWQKGALCR